MNLWNAQKRFNHYNPWTIAIRLKDFVFQFRCDSSESSFALHAQKLPEPYLLCEMDLRLLTQILQRKAHWNSAEIGCHIDFIRQPDQYLPDIHTLMSFINLQLEQAETLTTMLSLESESSNVALEPQH